MALMDSFIQGAGFVNNLQQQKIQNERQAENDAANREMRAMQGETHKLQVENLTAQIDERKQKQGDKDFMYDSLAGAYDVPAEQWTPDMVDKLAQQTRVNPSMFLTDPATGTSKARGALNQAQMVMSGKVKANDPASIEAFNTLFDRDLHKGLDEELPDGTKIVGKQIDSIIPSPDGKGVMIGLTVTKSDGSTYHAPMTDGRSAGKGDDNVKVIPLDSLIQHAAGIDALDKIYSIPNIQSFVKKRAEAMQQLNGKSNLEDKLMLMNAQNQAANERLLMTIGAQNGRSQAQIDAANGRADADRDLRMQSEIGRIAAGLQKESIKAGKELPDDVAQAKARIQMGQAGQQDLDTIHNFQVQSDTAELMPIFEKSQKNLSPMISGITGDDPTADEVTKQAVTNFTKMTGRQPDPAAIEQVRNNLMPAPAKPAEKPSTKKAQAAPKQTVINGSDSPMPANNAPQKAIDYLKQNNTPEMRKHFKDKYGYVPDF